MYKPSDNLCFMKNRLQPHQFVVIIATVIFRKIHQKTFPATSAKNLPRDLNRFYNFTAPTGIFTPFGSIEYASYSLNNNA